MAKVFGPNQNFDGLAPTTTKGDLIARDTSINVRVPVGTNGQVLVANSGATGGVGWTGIASSLSNPMTTVGDIIYGGNTGSPTRLGGPTSSTIQFLTSTGNGSTAVAPAWAAFTGATLVALTTEGSGTFVTATGALWLSIRICGSGGGGAGGGTSPGASGNGATSLVSGVGATIICGGGQSGGNSGTGGVGTGGDINVTGQDGEIGALGNATSSNGGRGGSTPLGQGGVNRGTNSTGGSPKGFGSGGGGGGDSLTSGQSFGGGGGGYSEKRIVSPAAAYSYTVGTRGSAGTAGTSGQAGATGAPGVVLIEQHFQ